MNGTPLTFSRIAVAARMANPMPPEEHAHLLAILSGLNSFPSETDLYFTVPLLAGVAVIHLSPPPQSVFFISNYILNNPPAPPNTRANSPISTVDYLEASPESPMNDIELRSALDRMSCR